MKSDRQKVDAGVQSYVPPHLHPSGNGFPLNMRQVMMGITAETGRGLTPSEKEEGEERRKREAIQDKKVEPKVEE